MTGQQLKNSILQMAVQGKLVPQDPNDEPASVLLERIRKEKEQLIKEGKIKKEKNPSYIFRGADNLPYEKVGKNEPVCIADEVPFDIPERWEWVRLGSVCQIARGGSPRPIKQFLTNDEDGINWIKISDSDKGGKYISSTKEKIIPEGVSKSRMVHAGDFLLTNSMSFGRPYILNIDGCIHDGWLVLSDYSSCYEKDFLFYMLSSRFAYFQFCEVVSGAVVKNLNSEKVAAALFPLPPLEEQRRIVQAIEKIEPFIDEYTEMEEVLSGLTNSFPEQLKKSILQWAVQGKLVPQDPDDEPASVLLERIRAEKEQLIKAGKIKRDKHESVIFRRDNSHYEKRGSVEVCIDDEIPFEIPENWCWSRLSTLCKSISDGDHQPPPQVPYGIPFVVISNVSSGKIDLSNTRFVPHDYYANLHESRIPCRDDILFTVTGSYGIVIPVDIDDSFCFQRHIALLKPLQIATEFLSIWLDTPVVYEQCKRCATGTAQKTVGLNSLKNILIPIPPTNEQVRILKQLQKVLPSITL